MLDSEGEAVPVGVMLTVLDGVAVLLEVPVLLGVGEAVSEGDGVPVLVPL